VAEPAELLSELVRAELVPVLLEPLKELLAVLAVPAAVVLSVAVVAVPDEPKVTLPVISS